MPATAAVPVFRQVRKESTTDRVYDSIREAILSGRLKSGERISEIPLSKEFEVSRAVIREALLRLAHDGFVEQNSYKGTRVILLTPEQVDEILRARVLIEVEVVREANRRLAPAEKKELRARARELSGLKSDPTAFAAKDLELHQRIWELSGNRTLAGVLRRITAPLFAMGTIVRHSTIIRKSGVIAPLGEHVELVEKICDGTEEQAAEAIRLHIYGSWTSTRERLRSYLAQRRKRSKAAR
jgi:DNA-binding GntR family transcriptional regulator